MRARLFLPPGDRPREHFRAGRLLVERCLWAVATGLALFVFTATIPARYHQLVDVAAANRPYLATLGLDVPFLVGYLAGFDAVAMIAFCLIAGVIVWRRSDDWLALLVSAMLLLVGVMLTRPVEAMTDIPTMWRLPFLLALALGQITVILFMFVFPDGRFVPAWSRGPAIVWVTWVAGWFLLSALVLTPRTWPPLLQPGWAVAGWLGSGLALQIYRYRRISTTVQRQQTKWVVTGLVASAIGFVVFLYVLPTLRPVLREPGPPNLLYILLGVPALYFSLLLLPLAIGISILRYRLWDISVILNRTLVYGALTLLLTAVYFTLVLLLQPLFRTMSGHNSPLTMAVSTLATAVLFYPLRQRVQAAIDHSLFPDRHDAALVLAALSTWLRDEVDLARLNERLQAAVAEVLHPVSLSTWLSGSGGFAPLPGTQVPAAGDVATAVPPADPLVAALAGAAEDVYLLAEAPPASAAATRLRESGSEVLMLLRSRGELIGWIGLGHRRDERGYSIDDLRFLSQVAAQAGPAIRVAQLALEQQVAALERQRLDQQLHLARVVQQTLLPRSWPALRGWAVAAHSQPAQAVGGDFYDFFQFKDGHLGLVIGDVSDKGIPAALLMATTRSLLRSVAYQYITPAAVLRRTNRLLRPDLPEGLFVTCLYALLDPASGRLTLANAGHNPPCYRTSAGVVELWATGTPLGWLPNVHYEERELTLAPGECLLFYSDGITEVVDATGDLFATARLQAALQATRSVGPALVEELLQAVTAFSGRQAADDDLTLVTLHRLEGEVGGNGP